MVNDNINEKIALQVTDLNIGGTQRYVRDLALAFVKRNIQFIVITDYKSEYYIRELEEAGIKIINLDISAGTLKGEYITCFKSVLKAEKVNILHASPWIRWEWIKEACQQEKVTFIRTLHHTVVAPKFRQFLGITRPKNFIKIWKEIFISALTHPAYINITYKSEAGLKTQLGPGIKTTTIHLGVPQSPYKSSPENNSNHPIFIWVGSLIERKRPLFLLNAFNKLLIDFPNAELNIIGDGPESSKARSFASERINGRVNFLGVRQNVYELMSKAQIFVLSSENEGLPYVILEAMAVGLPIITTECGSVTEAVINNETGIVVPVNSEYDFTNAMIKLSSNPQLRKEMGNAGFYRWQENFTLELMVKKTLQAYLLLK